MGPFDHCSPIATLTCDLDRTVFDPPNTDGPAEPMFADCSEQVGISAPVTIVSRVTKGAFPRYLPARFITVPAGVELWTGDGAWTEPEQPPADPGPAQFREVTTAVTALWAMDGGSRTAGAGRRLTLKRPRGIARWARQARASFAPPAIVWVRTSETPADCVAPKLPGVPPELIGSTVGAAENSWGRLPTCLFSGMTGWQPASPQVEMNEPTGYDFTIAVEGDRLLADGEWLRLPGATVTPEAPPTGHGIDLEVTEGAVFNRRVAAVRVPGQSAEAVSTLIDWGDGSPAAAGTVVPDGESFAISGRHCFEAAGVYVATVSVLVRGEEVLALPAAATVDDAPFHLGRLLVRPQAGLEFVGAVATLTDTNPLNHHGDEYTATIRWGDGRSSPGVVRPQAEGGFAVVGWHTYAVPGARTITVEVCAAGGRSAMVTTLATIGEPAESEDPIPSAAYTPGG